MTTDAKQKSPSPGQLERHFISPYSLYDCRWRLRNRVEWPKKSWEHPVEVDIKDAKDGVMDFRINRPTSNFGLLSVKLPMTRAYGTLAEQADGTTQVWVVVGTMRISYFLYGFVTLVNGLLLTCLCSLFVYTHPDLVYLLVIPLLLLIGSLWHGYRQFKTKHQELLKLVERALMDRPI